MRFVDVNNFNYNIIIIAVNSVTTIIQIEKVLEISMTVTELRACEEHVI